MSGMQIDLPVDKVDGSNPSYHDVLRFHVSGDETTLKVRGTEYELDRKELTFVIETLRTYLIGSSNG